MKASDVTPGRVLLSPLPDRTRWTVEAVSGGYVTAVAVKRMDGEVLYIPDLIAAGWTLERLPPVIRPAAG